MIDLNSVYIGAVVSLAVSLIRKYFNTNTGESYLAAFVVSFLTAAVYSYLTGNGSFSSLLSSFGQIVISSQAVYATITSELQKPGGVLAPKV